MSKLTQYAHPRGWEKGEPVQEAEAGGKPVALLARDLVPTPGASVRFLVFTTEDMRKQWLKWWRK